MKSHGRNFFKIIGAGADNELHDFPRQQGDFFFKWKRVDHQKRNLFPRRSANTVLLKSTFMNIKGWRCVYRDDWFMSTEYQVEHQQRNKSIPAQRHIVF